MFCRGCTCVTVCTRGICARVSKGVPTFADCTCTLAAVPKFANRTCIFEGVPMFAGRTCIFEVTVCGNGWILEVVCGCITMCDASIWPPLNEDDEVIFEGVVILVVVG